MLIQQGFSMLKKIALLIFFPLALFGMYDENYRTELRIREERVTAAQLEYSTIHTQYSDLNQKVAHTEDIVDSLRNSLLTDQQIYEKKCRELSTASQNFDPETIPTTLEKHFREQELACQKKIKKIIQGHQEKQEIFDQRLQEHAKVSGNLQKALTTLKKSIKNNSQKLIKLQACIALFNNEEVTASVEAPPSYETYEKTSEEVCVPGPSAPSEDTPPGYVQSQETYDKDEA